ncbi:hypothetical protein M3Y94_00090900 [Aphelenchoides besseyi]|nr:hypothetical protein M3Y94_00090900 [Aphelenchoides besseyi]
MQNANQLSNKAEAGADMTVELAADNQNGAIEQTQAQDMEQIEENVEYRPRSNPLPRLENFETKRRRHFPICTVTYIVACLIVVGLLTAGIVVVCLPPKKKE